ncbi:MAG: hypothetical protein D6749_01900 [Chloroflexota bacterium]|nr:MAG: hypothetical protein D6749_01900 [Chloroflexota bacterium]
MTSSTAPSATAESAVTRQVIVRLDDRMRLIAAVLAATNYPEKSQEQRKHGTHAHARATRKWLIDFMSHPAVHAAQALLDQGMPPKAFFAYALRLSFPALEADLPQPRWVPPRWHEHLRHFYEQTRLAEWWENESPHWQTAVRHLRETFANVDLYAFLEPFVGRVAETLVFMPNICYPSDQTIGLQVGGELVVIMPPPIAWGDSAPWPYKDDPALAYRSALAEYGALLMNAYLQQHADVVASISDRPLPIVEDQYAARRPSWHSQFIGVFVASITALFLEDSVSALEARSFTQYMQKVEHLTALPTAVSVIRRYLEDYRSGRYASFAEFIPKLPNLLKVGKTISAL